MDEKKLSWFEQTEAEVTTKHLTDTKMFDSLKTKKNELVAKELKLLEELRQVQKEKEEISLLWNKEINKINSVLKNLGIKLTQVDNVVVDDTPKKEVSSFANAVALSAAKEEIVPLVKLAKKVVSRKEKIIVTPIAPVIIKQNLFGNDICVFFNSPAGCNNSEEKCSKPHVSVCKTALVGKTCTDSNCTAQCHRAFCQTFLKDKYSCKGPCEFVHLFQCKHFDSKVKDSCKTNSGEPCKFLHLH